MNQIDYMTVPMEWALKYGFEEAALLWWIVHWIKVNAANNRNFKDNKTWTYNSKNALSELFPCWTEKQIRRLLDSLINQNVLIKGEYNTSSYDRTSWYSLVDESAFLVRSTCPNGPVTFAQMGQPIPIKNTNKEDKEIKDIVTPSSNKKTLIDSSKYYYLSELLITKIKACGSSMKIVPKIHIPKWADSFRLMVEQDKHNEKEIEDMIEAIFADNFWSMQVRCAGKMRKQWNDGKFDKLKCSQNAQEAHEQGKKLTPWEELLRDCGDPGNKVFNRFIEIWQKHKPGEWEECTFFPDNTSNTKLMKPVFDILVKFKGQPQIIIDKVCDYFKGLKNEF